MSRKDRIRTNRRLLLIREIKLVELMKLIPEDELVIIFDDQADLDDEDQALFNGTVADFWKRGWPEDSKMLDINLSMVKVNGFQCRELRDTIGAAIMIVVYG